MKAILTIGVALLTICLAASPEKKSWNFDAGKPGAIAGGFTNEVGAWKVVADPTAPSKPKVLAQTAKNSGTTFNLALVSGTSFQNVDLSVKMKAIAGGEDQGGGLVWRAKDKSNYYIARYNPLEDNYRVYKVQNGSRSQFESATVKGDKNWHTLRVTMTGDHIECFLDGKKRLDDHDSTFPNAGMIGLWTKADAQSHFDDLMVSTQ
jgi:hypothetical protein